ncbi:MAG: hypothetical protein A2504_00750 [Bdellovibrionales bacterium RIFOXYD12_FULL_39_22]|nr:MAG: hypothetical protein A2385_03370 [Bdellovibrionales bacterium RIFOXYB1_FULL_39_21]OFZ42633.1 MAG: hypothetical protein A2485_09935 [Bdellovibrionales bacterium RIFOXYC12_FULL_39_17]OFZ47099.1 MAG: hypothetical protein A2404_15360 [Bdellovibrionales bacterium RIFOXYC1_FULL_39_130]OFZ75347.1 MAG: hypothetical protein A2560_14135 [Bdellovibrionales bacterium RIFOXYD1_FULL_39_84]OFZ93298.1 MAG: hypothetical protein A2504_00750 [Bdellovibrionales bacterium RIFOXYD12_FULL_39_22]HLE10026.1 hy
MLTTTYRFILLASFTILFCATYAYSAEEGDFDDSLFEDIPTEDSSNLELANPPAASPDGDDINPDIEEVVGPPPKESFVKWDIPQKEILNEKWANITISGQTTPNCKMIIYKESLISYPGMYENIWPRQFKKIETQKLLAKISPVDLASSGAFYIKLKIPQYRYKIILAFRDNFGNIQKNLITLKLDNGNFKYSITTLASNFSKENPDKNFKYFDAKERFQRLGLKVGKHELWVGTGYSYMAYEQSYSTGQSNFNFMSSAFFPLHAKLRMPIADNFKFHLDGVQAPGSATANDLVSFSGSTSFTWQTASAELLYTPSFLQFRPFNITTINFSPTFGASYHLAPFVLQGEISKYSIVKNNFFNLSGGINLAINEEESNALELFFAYQYLLYDGSNYNLTTNKIYDLGISWIYMTSERWRIALSWIKRKHRYDFDYNNTTLADEVTQGTELLNASLFELRLGYVY